MHRCEKKLHSLWYTVAQKGAGPPRNRRTEKMKDRPDRAARLQLIGRMFAGQSWQTAIAESQLNISRSTAYRLLQRALDEDRAPLVFLDERHAHPNRLPDPMHFYIN